MFDVCELDARGGVFKQTALAFASCPDDLALWLVEQGADISAGDTYGETPLHSRARSWQGRIGVLLDLGADVNRGEGGRGTPLHGAADAGHLENVRQLLEHGAGVDALDEDGFTPLEICAPAMQQCADRTDSATCGGAARCRSPHDAAHAGFRDPDRHRLRISSRQFQ
ncbi:ankyrin repeat domain-containing protein [Sphingomonas sp. QA11]|uniref:ankyrin repeat domain-containing protein n=1 Tax=Sphingomonas sp. QA11 TaxID=2950605 RepID=UPI003FA6E7E4